MADTSKLITYDLTREIPSGFTVSGLSDAQSDGTNYFRQPLGHKSEIGFQIDKLSFIELEYQLFSPDSVVTGLVKLDGKELSSQIFPAGKFIPNALAGDFITAGKHTLEIDYQCQPDCQTPPSQYWTKLYIVSQGIPQTVQQVGLKIIRLNQYAPNTKLKLIGTGNLRFDGVNFYRPVEKSLIDFIWPINLKPFNVNFQLLGNQNFKVNVKMNQKILITTNGSAKKDVFLHINLQNEKAGDRINIEVKCLETPNIPCANLYFPSVTARDNSTSWANSLPLSLSFILLAIFLLTRFLLSKRQIV